MVPYMDNMDNDMSGEVFTITFDHGWSAYSCYHPFYPNPSHLVAGPTNENAQYKQGLTNDRPKRERGTYSYFCRNKKFYLFTLTAGEPTWLLRPNRKRLKSGVRASRFRSGARLIERSTPISIEGGL